MKKSTNSKVLSISTQDIINEIIQLKTQPQTDTTKLRIQKLQQKLQQY